MLRLTPHALLVVASLSAAIAPPASAAIRYVRASQSLPLNQQDGLSWETAFVSLQAGIDAAVAGDEVRVASGTYRPTTGTDRTASFVLKQGVRLRGGYAGVGDSPDDRSVGTTKTRLSGDIGNFGSAADNSFHVVRASGLTAAAVLDGFEIRDGNADGAGNDGIGGGMLVTSASPAIVRCMFVENNAKKGGAIGRVSGFSASSPMFIHGSIFADNTADQGAAIFAQFAPIQLMNSTVADNAGVAAVDLSTISVASIFSSSIIYRNAGGSSAELSQFRTTSAPLTVTRCCIEGWDNIAPASATTIADDPRFVYEDSYIFVIERHELRGDSPCIDQGECTITDIADTDSDGNFSEPLARTLRDLDRSIDDAFFAEGGAASNPTTDIGAQEKLRQRTILVNHAATGANDGTTWADAYTDLQSALAELADPRTGGQGQIWVAAGTYKPTTGTDVDATFLMSGFVSILGGFAGNETTLSQRDWRAHRTILSGELGPPGPSGNSRHVVTMGQGTNFLDGVIVRDGNAPPITGGGGILVQAGATAEIARCIVTANTGTGPGSAIRLLPGADSSVEIGHCAVVGNSATLNGSAGVFIDQTGFFAVDRTLIAGNATQNGSQGALRVQNTLGVNTANIRSSVITDNTIAGAHSMNAQISSDGGLMNVSHCAIESFSPSLGNATIIACFAIGPDAGMINARGDDGIYGTSDDNYRPTPCGPLVDAGAGLSSVGELSSVDLNDDGFLNFAVNDFLDQLPLVDLPVANVLAGRDIGPIELQSSVVADPDLDGNGVVTAADLGALLGAWGTIGSDFDLTGDCVVDAADLAVILGAWD